MFVQIRKIASGQDHFLLGDRAEGYAVQQTSDDGFIVVGHTRKFGAFADVWLIKTNSYGDTLWTKVFGDSFSDYGYDVKRTKDGGYVIAGSKQHDLFAPPDFLLIKTDSVGK